MKRRVLVVLAVLVVGCGGGSGNPSDGSSPQATGGASTPAGGASGGGSGGDISPTGGTGAATGGALGKARNGGSGGISPPGTDGTGGRGGMPSAGGAGGQSSKGAGGSGPAAGGQVGGSAGRGGGGAGGSPTTGGAGGQGGTIVCVGPGSACPDPSSCCTGTTCVGSSSSTAVCAGNCTTGSECVSGCCAPLSNVPQKVCLPLSYCSAPSTATGTIVAGEGGGELLIQTSTGPAFFDGSICIGFYQGDTVTFGSAPEACAINTISKASPKASCSVFCDGTGYPGVVAATSLSSIAVTTASGTKIFTVQGSCGTVLTGHNVVLLRNPEACATNTLADVNNGAACRVSCS